MMLGKALSFSRSLVLVLLLTGTRMVSSLSGSETEQETESVVERKLPASLRKRHPHKLPQQMNLKDFRDYSAVMSSAPTQSPVAVPPPPPQPQPTHTPTGQILTQTPTWFPTSPPPPTLAPTTDNNVLPLCQRIDSPVFASPMDGPVMTGRIGRTFGPSDCSFPREYPFFLFSSQFYYQQVGPFRNRSTQPACARVMFDPGSCPTNAVHAVAFSQAFDPLQIEQNYLADVGNAANFDAFQFVVPANQDFYVVGQSLFDTEFWDDAFQPCVFGVSVDFKTYNSGWIVSPPLGSSGRTTMSRPRLSSIATSCALPISYPGTVGTLESYYEELGPFLNPSADSVCVNVIIDLGDCFVDAPLEEGGGPLVRVAAYTDFDAANPEQGYLGRDGVFFESSSSSSPRNNTSFEFTIPGNEEFVLVGLQVGRGQTNGEGCVFSVIVEMGRDDCPATSR